MESLSHKRLEEFLASVRQGVSRATAHDPSLVAELDTALRTIHQELSLILHEHAGMADELLRAYEQLGIVFEVTRRLATVHTEQEVVHLFVDSLSATYREDGLSTVYREPDGKLKWTGDRTSAPEELAAAVTESIDARQVVVQAFNHPVDGIGSVLSAPVFAGGDFVCAIALARRPDVHRFEASDMSLLEVLVSFCGDLIRNHRLVLELKTLSVDVIRALVSTIDQKDPYTSGHSQRVGHYATLLGKELGLDKRGLQMLEWAALLHDVGKIGIHDLVLNKQGKLTDQEYEHIKEHPVRSYEVVRQVPQLADALDGVHHHHERYDGSGYPDGLAGEDIPLQARIVQVADIFDALTTSRSYRTAFSWEKALDILQEEAGTVVDPRLGELFDRLIRRKVAENGLRFEYAGEAGTPNNPPGPGQTGQPDGRSAPK